MNKVLLSFDIEEFDMPLEYGRQISLAEQLSVSKEGSRLVLDLLKQYDAPATFFSTVVFAQNAPSVIERIRFEGHELASHGCYHSSFHEEHLLASREALHELSGLNVQGFRMPRMMPVSDDAVAQAGYRYNSSINPVWLPGRYDNRHKPRTIFSEGGLWQIPASATPALRVPLFWLSFHNLPLATYLRMCGKTIATDGYLNLYFHPWEFTDLSLPHLGMPWYVRRNAGTAMLARFDQLLNWMKTHQYTFTTISAFLSQRYGA